MGALTLAGLMGLQETVDGQMDGIDCIIHPFAQSSAQLLHVLQKMGHQEWTRMQHSRLDDLHDTLDRIMKV